MANTEYYIGHYRSSFKNLKFDRLKYTTICYILDFFALIKSTTGQNWSNTREQLINAVLLQGGFKDTPINRASIDTAISQMIMMGMLSRFGEQITFAEGAIEAYKTHNFHNVLFSVNAEYQARVLSMIAISVAIISCLASIIFFVLKN